MSCRQTTRRGWKARMQKRESTWNTLCNCWCRYYCCLSLCCWTMKWGRCRWK